MTTTSPTEAPGVRRLCHLDSREPVLPEGGRSWLPRTGSLLIPNAKRGDASRTTMMTRLIEEFKRPSVTIG
jgi:hypothetical protein